MMKTSTQSLSDFLENPTIHIRAINKSHQPEILTTDGEAPIVLQDLESYQEMQELAEQARQDARLRSSMDYVEDNRKCLSSNEVLAAIEKEYLTA